MIRIPLTQSYVTTIDDEDAWALQHKWHALVASNGCVYAVRNRVLANGKRRPIRMHREILEITDPKVDIDHIDGDGLNNRRINLRAVTHSENMRNVTGTRMDNTSGYQGVSWNKRDKKWRAWITLGKIHKSLGYYNTAEEANTARLAAEAEHYGIQPRRAWAHEA